MTTEYSALYCTPHIKVAGRLILTEALVLFDPDASHPHVREFGSDQYELRLEIGDVLECGAMAMPVEDKGLEMDEIAYFLQLHVVTLDGRLYCKREVEDAWCIVFRMQSRGDLYEAAQIILCSVESQKQHDSSAAAPGSGTSTSIPFPCLDCISELEAVSDQQRRRRMSGRTSSTSSSPQRKTSQESDPRSPGPCAAVVLQPGTASQTLLSQALAACLLDYLPIGLRLPGAVEWVLRYSPKAHGVSLATLFRNLADCEKTILLVQDVEEHVFGSFAPEPWEPGRGRFYGSGEAFVFSFGRPGKHPEARVYPWAGPSQNTCFMYSDYELIAMGGGDGHHAVVIRSDLLRGNSSPTSTFQNPMLASSEEFVVRDIEIWAFEETA